MPAYAEIVDHKAPAEATAGESIVIGGTIRNTGTDASYCYIRVEDEFGAYLAGDWKWLAVGEELSVSDTVTMPSEDYTTYVRSAHDEPGRWTWDEKTEFTTKLKVLPAYAEIIDHEAPAEAVAGESIYIGGTIKNTGGSPSYCYIRVEDEFGVVLASEWEWLAVGEELSAGKYTDMPNENYTTYVRSAHDEPGRWTWDEKTSFTTRLTVPPPIAKLVDYDYPESAEAGTAVTITVTLRNDGGAGYCNAQLEDRETGEILSGVGDTLDAGETRTWEFPAVPPMPDKDWLLRIRYGHEEYGEQYWDGSVNFTITLIVPVPPDMKIENLSYPTSAIAGESVAVSWDCCNRGGDTAYPQWTRLIDRDTGEELHRHDTFRCAPGFCSHESPTLTMPNKDWNLRIEAGYDTTLTDTTDFIVEVAVLAGMFTEVMYWIDGMTTWETIWSDPAAPYPVPPPNYPERPAKAGEEIHLAVYWVNTGNVDVTGHVDLTLTSPTGKTYAPEAVSNQDRSAAPGGGYAVQFAPVLLDEAGTWTLSIALTGDGQELDRETTTFTVEPPLKRDALLTMVFSAPTRFEEVIDTMAVQKVVKGDVGTFSGKLTDYETGEALAGRTVVFRKNTTHYGSTTTRTDGSYALKYTFPTVAETSPFAYNTYFAGDDAYAEAFVTAVSIMVEARIPALTFDINPKTVSPGESLTWEGRMTDPKVTYYGISDKRVYLQEDGTDVDSDVTDRDGDYIGVYPAPTTPGTYDYRARFPGGSHQPCVSRTVAVTVHKTI